MKKLLLALILPVSSFAAVGGLPGVAAFDTNNFYWKGTNMQMQPNQKLSSLVLSNGGLNVTAPPGTTSYVYLAQMDVAGIVVDPRNHGAKCDGLTDDTIAVQKAANDATNGTLMFPVGTTLVKNISLSSNVRVSGVKGSKVMLPPLVSLDGSPVFSLNGTNITFDGLTIDGNRANQPADGFSDSFNTGGNGRGRAYRAAIAGDGTLHNVSYLTVINCEFTGTYGAAVAVQNITNVFVANNSFHENNFECLFLDRDTTGWNENVWFLNNTAHNIQSGDAIVNADVVSIINTKNVIETGNRADLFERDFTKFNGVIGAYISGNIGKTNTLLTGGWPALQFNAELAGAYNANVFVSGNTWDSLSKGMNMDYPMTNFLCVGDKWTNFRLTNSDGIFLGSTQLNNVVFKDVTLTGVGRHGWVTVGGTHVTLQDSTILGTTNNAIQSTGLYVWLQNGDLDYLSIIHNHVGGFNQDQGNFGVLGFNQVAGTEQLTHAMISQNIFDAGTNSNNHGIYAGGTNWISAVFNQNTVEGNILTIHQTNLVALFNRPTGQASWGANCAELKDSTPFVTLAANTVGAGAALPVFTDSTDRILTNSFVFLLNQIMSGLKGIDQSGDHFLNLASDNSGNQQRLHIYGTPSGGYFIKTEKGGTFTTNYDATIETGDTGNLRFGVQAPTAPQWQINGSTARFEATSGNISLDGATGNITSSAGTISGVALLGQNALQTDSDGTAGNIRLLLWDVSAGTFKRVSVGASDSGGTGFMVLRVPN